MQLWLLPLSAALSLRAHQTSQGTPKFSPDYFKSSGKFVPASEMGKMYHSVVKILYHVDCDNKLHVAKKDLDKMPKAELDAFCAGMTDSGKSSECKSLVSDLESEFEKEPEDFDVNAFCESMWNLISEDSAAANEHPAMSEGPPPGK